jgi:hypothetical protein
MHRRLLCVSALVLLLMPGAAAGQLTYSSGQSVSPAFEGWWQNDDGTYTLFFGYMNDNWAEELDVPIGPDNRIEPGGPDQGQPTHFLPRRNMFLFQVQVPPDFGDQELVWTLTTHGVTQRAYASLRTDYLVDKQVIGTEVGANRGGVSQDWQWNEPPEVTLGVDQRRRVRVGEGLPLVAFATDADGIPSSTKAGVTLRPSTPRTQSERHPAYRRPQQVVPGNSNGLRLSWFVYRGAGDVTFEPPQMKVWQDTRPYANSPWSPPFEIPPVPPDGKWEAVATFEEPGTYVLRALASDGALFTAQDIVVTVMP